MSEGSGNGDFQPFTRGFSKEELNRLLELQRKYRVKPIRPGWEQTDDGIIPPPVTAFGEFSQGALWNLNVESADDGTVSLSKPGTLNVYGTIDTTNLLTITDVDETFTAVANSYLVLKIAPVESAVPSVTLQLMANSVDWYPYPFETEIDGNGERILQAFYLPLWKFVATATTVPDGYTTLTINDDLKAVKNVTNSNFQLRNVLFSDPDDGRLVSGYEPFPVSYMSF